MGEGRLQLRGTSLGSSRRIVQFVGHSCTELAQCGQLFTLPQHNLLLQIRLFQVAQPLLLQAGVQARPQQHRVERLGQVILGAHFDASYGALYLIQSRNDNDRDVPHLGIKLDRFQELKAIHPRHEDVEEYHVE